MEITTSRLFAGSGTYSMIPFRKWTFVRPASAAFAVRGRASRRSCPARTRCRSARPALRSGSRRSRRQSRGRAPCRLRGARRPLLGCRSRAKLVWPPRASRRAARRRRAPRRTCGVRLAVLGAAPAAAAAASGALGDGAGRLGVAAAHLVAQLVGGCGHHQHTPFRSATAARWASEVLLSSSTFLNVLICVGSATEGCPAVG